MKKRWNIADPAYTASQRIADSRRTEILDGFSGVFRNVEDSSDWFEVVNVVGIPYFRYPSIGWEYQAEVHWGLPGIRLELTHEDGRVCVLALVLGRARRGADLYHVARDCSGGGRPENHELFDYRRVP